MNNKIKHELNSIKIPKELHKRSEKGILKAKLEMRDNKKKSFKILPYIGMVAALLILIPICVSQFYNHTPTTPVKSGEAQKDKQTNATTIPDSQKLTAQQLSAYFEKNGKTLPFSGSNVTRVSPQNAVQNLTNQTQIQPNGSNFASQVEVVLDEWKGKLNNKSFDFEVYQNQSTKETFVGVVYDQQIKVAYSCQSKVCMVHNFTGNYVTFSASKTSEKFFSINLSTGEVIPYSKRKLNLDLAGIDSSHSANKAEWIIGLNKKYPFKP